jgi:phosphomannomutase
MALAFGTSGIRGLATDLTDGVCQNYARAFVRHCKDVLHPSPTHFIVAGDLRTSTLRIVAAVSKGIQDEGGIVLDAGMIPTPALAYGCQLKRVAGIMVTGSHIPGDRNGIKFYFPEGEILKKDEAPILAHFGALEGVIRSSSVSVAIEKIDLETAFISRYVDYFGVGSLKGQTVVLYEHSSAAREVLKKILDGLAAQVVSYGRSEEFVPVDTEALGDMSEFKKIISDARAVALVSTDGDGDRPMILDESGFVVRGDQIGVLSALAVEADAVVTPISSSTALEKTQGFLTVRRTKIGSPYVVDAMQVLIEAGAQRVIGYEANGGLLLGSALREGANGELSALMTRDSVLPILLLLKASVSYNAPISRLVSALPQRYTASDLIKDFPVEKSKKLLEDFVQVGLLFFTKSWEKDLGAAQKLDLTDGVRVEFTDGVILHFRPSGNAPEFRIYAEAESGALAAKWVAKAKDWAVSLV